MQSALKGMEGSRRVNICHLEKTVMGNLFTDIATLFWRSLLCSGKEGYKQISKIMQKPIFASQNHSIELTINLVQSLVIFDGKKMVEL